MYIVNVESKTSTGKEATEIFKYVTESQEDAFCEFWALSKRDAIYEAWPYIEETSDLFVSVKLMQDSTLMGYHTHCFTDYFNYFDDSLNEFMGKEV